MNKPPEIKTCHCTNPNVQEQKITESDSKIKKGSKALPSAALSIFIAFFPKCPFCWAAYMSMFGSLGMANVPYMKWLYPCLIAFLGLHLLLLFRRVREKGYGPFLLSLAGALIILGGRAFLPAYEPVLLAGMLLILSGSLWNNFSINRFKTSISN